MRIVSQRRDLSVDFDRVIIKIDYGKVLYAVSIFDTRGQGMLLGQYDTSERAKEVFEDIHKAYAPIYSISDGLTEEQLKAMVMPSKNVIANNIVNTGPEMCLTTYDNYVYYMPEE